LLEVLHELLERGQLGLEGVTPTLCDAHPRSWPLALVAFGEDDEPPFSRHRRLAFAYWI
jgi:hypothetical protein